MHEVIRGFPIVGDSPTTVATMAKRTAYFMFPLLRIVNPSCETVRRQHGWRGREGEKEEGGREGEGRRESGHERTSGRRKKRVV